MNISDFIPILLYCLLGLAILTQFLIVLFVSRLLKDLSIALERSKLCRVKQVEGETVRYSLQASMNKKIAFYTTLKVLLPVILVMIVASTGLYMWKQANDVDMWHSIRLIAYAVLIVIILLINIIIISTYMKKLEKTTDSYKNTMTVVTNALAIINKKYPIRDMLTASYPPVVDELYTYLLKRFINKNDDMSTEEGISGLTRIVENGDFEQVFGYLKLDITYKDWRLVRNSYRKACNALKMSSCDDNTADLEGALGLLQTYEPEQEYHSYRIMMRKFYIYTIVMMFILLFPLFDMLYKKQGVFVIAASSIFITIVLSLYMYYNASI